MNVIDAEVILTGNMGQLKTEIMQHLALAAAVMPQAASIGGDLQPVDGYDLTIDGTAYRAQLSQVIVDFGETGYVLLRGILKGTCTGKDTDEDDEFYVLCVVEEGEISPCQQVAMLPYDDSPLSATLPKQVLKRLLDD